MKLHENIKFFFLVSSIVFAGHPLNTDDAFNLGKNSFEFEFVYEFYDYDAIMEMTIPITVSYGLFNNSDIVFSLAYHKSWDDNFTLNSLGDATIELKQILYDDLLRIGIKPFVTLPTGDESIGFGKGKVNYGTYLLLTKEWEELHIHTQFGYSTNHNVIGERPDFWEYSLAAEKFLSKKLSTVIEFGIARNCCFESLEHTKFLLGGIIYQIDDMFVLDLGLMKGLTDDNPNFGLLSGITLGL